MEDNGRVKRKERIAIWNFFSYCITVDETAEVLLALLADPAVSSQFGITQQSSEQVFFFSHVHIIEFM